jgi:hypothetical protein
MKKNDQFSDAETEQRREAALRRMLSTPHKPHKPLGKKAKASASKRASAKPKSA